MNLQLDGLTFPLRVRPEIPMTDLELERFSGENKPYRIERNPQGELIMMTPVGTIGSNHEFYVSGQLFRWIEETENGIGFAPNGGFTLKDGSVLAPDGAWVATERWTALSKDEQAGFAHLCPDFLMEVRSESDNRKTLETKMQTWLENGARLAWLIDPLDATVTVYRPGELPETLERPDVVLGHAPVEGFRLTTTRLWPEL